MRPYSRLVTLGYLLGPVLIVVSHFGSLLLITTGITWGAICWAVFLYLVRMLATTAIYHRLLTHKAYRVSSLFLRLGCIVGASAGQMGPSWWKAHHMAHHRQSDEEGDTHSPFTPFTGWRGFLWSQGGWLFSSHFFPAKLPADVESDNVLRWIDRLHFLPMIALGVVSYLFGGVLYLGAFFLSTTVLFHGVQTVNSLSHLAGCQPFSTSDFSRNNAFVALITLGEGWHNLHHAFQQSARHGFTLRGDRVCRLPDPTYGFILMLENLRIASDLKIPSDAQLRSRSRISLAAPNASSLSAVTRSLG
jgi:stearoyl-CoA desaturase (delta-9 desaturase)